ncbi:HTH-type transcriptional regulator CdhR [Paraburkholderia domus]|uniref:GlxA family transcriptional regulator n=1 Tax=Paraburkholderia domus TaxID=2793075 RepID=UPI001912A7FA|nr:helix-turn-helix domain-containing protein [Paraburkholderia domus]MBK5089955.1 helix-turn-helix domain-containing protein [Burkholderia sp. R-69927]CAE6911160.1 HTH-type transcriptional regulator CdhR [Paraburkholderia domus]
MDLSVRCRVRTVDVVVYPGFKAIEAVGTVHVFDYANAHLRNAGQPPVYDIQIAAPEAGFVRSDTLIVLEAQKALNSLSLPDIAIVVGAREIERVLAETPTLVDWCQAVSPRVSRMVGMCSGSFFLAEAGLLNGRRATTHWSVARLLQQRYPAVIVESDSIFIRDGAIWTSAGVTAGMDMALAMVEEDLGREIALAVARDLVVYLKRPGGQSQFSVSLNSQMTAHPTIRRVQEWILASLDRDVTIGELARRAVMSERNFARVFVRETGHRPAEFVEIARVEMARRLLEEGDLPMKAVAACSGFHSDDQMRRAFQRRCGVTPGAYRLRFAGTGVTEGADAPSVEP